MEAQFILFIYLKNVKLIFIGVWLLYNVVFLPYTQAHQLYVYMCPLFLEGPFLNLPCVIVLTLYGCFHN